MKEYILAWLKILIVFVGMYMASYGFQEISETYQNYYALMKSSGTEFAPTIEGLESARDEGNKQSLYHFGIFFLGVFVSWLGLWWFSNKKSHNKSLKNGTREERRAP